MKNRMQYDKLTYNNIVSNYVLNETTKEILNANTMKPVKTCNDGIIPCRVYQNDIDKTVWILANAEFVADYLMKRNKVVR